MVILAAIVMLFIGDFSLTPWVTSFQVNYPTYSSIFNSSNAQQHTYIIQNSEKEILKLDQNHVVVGHIKSNNNSAKGFNTAKAVAQDMDGNAYVLDANFGGSMERSKERILKYSPSGKLLGVVYEYDYTNDSYILTKGKLTGLTYKNRNIYFVRTDNNGFFLEKLDTENMDKGAITVEEYLFKDAFFDITYFDINVDKELLTFATKAGDIFQYNFRAEQTIYIQNTEVTLPWCAMSTDNGTIFYSDIISNDIVKYSDGKKELLYKISEDESACYRLTSFDDKLIATANDAVYIINPNGGDAVKLFEYYFSNKTNAFRWIIFVLSIFAVIAFGYILVYVAKISRSDAVSDTLKMSLMVGMCIAFGAIISSVLILDNSNEQFHEKTYNELENISRIMASSIDMDVLLGFTGPADYTSKEYKDFVNGLREAMHTMDFEGERIYQAIWMLKDGVVYMMYDAENSVGPYYPFDVYDDDSYYMQAVNSKDYVHITNKTNEGSWLFTCGPIFYDGDAMVLIETGYDMLAIEKQTKETVTQITLIVATAAVAILFCMVEFILISNTYRRNRDKTDMGKTFYPELLRPISFLMFVIYNLSTAFLPMYAISLYKPILSLPRELIVTFPISADVIFAAIALFLSPTLLKKYGVPRISIVSLVMTVFGNILCFLANDIIMLTVAYIFIGFSGGTLILVISTIIASQKNDNDISSGFANYNASYLSGMNVGIVFGAIIAQFFHYRTVYLYSTVIAVVLFVIYVFLLKSNIAGHMFNVAVDSEKEANRTSLIRFVFNRKVFGLLFLVLVPYTVCLGFTTYFMPIFGTENGLSESNVGQLFLINGLFSILLGTTLCDLISKRMSQKNIMLLSIALNIISLVVFSLEPTIPFLIITVVLMGIAITFAATALQTHFSALIAKTNASTTKAMSIYSAVENLSIAVGPIVFSYILMSGVGLGVQMLCGVVCACMILYLFIGKE